jgi:formate/nitrite transporter FocA (FNT family)
MYFIYLVIVEGADITWTTFIVKNPIPTTIENRVGGALFVGWPYGYLFGKK